MEYFVLVALTLLAYLIGSISFAVLMSQWFGLEDPRTYGSKNPGATNVLRSGNKKAAAFTFLGDCLKGWVVVGSVVYWGEQWGILDNGVAYVAMAVFFGHLWPIFFNFKGGKGVATALGILFGMNIWLGVAALVSWLVVFYAFRYSSLAALITAVFAPFYYGLLFGPDIQLSAVTVISMLLVYRHRRNIADLLKGKEKRMRQEKR